MSDQPSSGIIPRATGLLVVEVRQSNPNGDPDRESDPRQRPDGRGEISPVSFKRKVRDLIERENRGAVWEHIKKELQLAEEGFDILESASRGFNDVRDAADAWQRVGKLLEDGKQGENVRNKYWDARIFGATFLEGEEESAEPKKRGEKKDRKYIRSGVAHFGLGLSVAPITIRRLTMTKKASAQEDKDRGMAPLGYRVVDHGVYCIPFFVNPTASVKSGCTRKDVDVLIAAIPYAYSHNLAMPRAQVEIRHAWLAEHKSPLGSCSDFALIDALTPKRRGEADRPSTSWDDYDVPAGLTADLLGRIQSLRDLMADTYSATTSAQ